MSKEKDLKEQRREKMREILSEVCHKYYVGDMTEGEKAKKEALTALEALMPKEDKK